jgi:xeroderma pigmentosum group C-complementing protein
MPAPFRFSTWLSFSSQDEPANSAAGGFLEDADKVVAAFHLPKNTHVVLSPLQVHKDTVQLSDADENESDPHEGPELRTYDLDDDEEVMDVDSERSFSNGDGKDFIPKTMQQLAEDAARRETQQKEAELRNGVKPEDKKHNVGLNGAHEEGSAVVSNSESSGRVTRSRSGAIKILTLALGASEKMARGRSLPSRQKVTLTSKISRKRKRPVEDGSEPEPEDDAETSNDEQDIDFVGDDTGGDGDDDGEYMSTRGTRTRIGQMARPRATLVARPSTRALHTPRSRRAKTTSQFEEER